MDDFSSHIGIIGGGIAGFTLGCTLKKYGINTVIFEKESMASESGAGISISPNGLIPLEHLDLMDDLKSNSYKSQKGILKYKSRFSNDSTFGPINSFSYEDSSFKSVITLPSSLSPMFGVS